MVERFGLVVADAAKPGFGDCSKVQQQAQGRTNIIFLFSEIYIYIYIHIVFLLQ
jgi:hypothetical protein